MISSGENIALSIKDELRVRLPDSSKIWRIYTSWEEGKQFVQGHCYVVIIVDSEEREYASIGSDVYLHKVNISIYVGVSARYEWVNDFERKFTETIMFHVQNRIQADFVGAYLTGFAVQKDYEEDYSYHIWKYRFTVNVVETRV